MATSGFGANESQINSLLQALAAKNSLNFDEQWHPSGLGSDSGKWDGTSAGASGSSSGGFHLGSLVKAPWHALEDTLMFAERPFYAMGGALTEGFRKNVTGGSVGDTLKAIGEGALHGIEGKTHYDIGDLIHNAADAYAAANEGKSNQNIEFADQAAGTKGDLANAGLKLPGWAKLAGVGADIGIDPLNVVSFGGIKALTKTVPLADKLGNTVKVDADLADAMSKAGKTNDEIVAAQKEVDARHASDMKAGMTSVDKNKNYAQWLNHRADVLGEMGIKDPWHATQEAVDSAVHALPASEDVGGGVDRLVNNVAKDTNTNLETGSVLGHDNEISALPKLPQHLQKSSPRFGPLKLQFDDDVTRALYTVANGGRKSAADHQFMSFLKNHFGGDFSDAEIRGMGGRIKDAVKSAAAQATGDVVRVKSDPSLWAKTPEHIAQNEAVKGIEQAAVAGVKGPHTAESELARVKGEMAAPQEAPKPYVSKLLEGEGSARKLTQAAKAALKTQWMKKLGINENLLNTVKQAAENPVATGGDKVALEKRANELVKERFGAMGTFKSFRQLYARAQKDGGAFADAYRTILEQAKKDIGYADNSAPKQLKEWQDSFNKHLNDVRDAELAKEAKGIKAAAKAVKATSVVDKTVPTTDELMHVDQLAEKTRASIESGAHKNIGKTFNAAKQKNLFNSIREMVTTSQVKGGATKGITRLKQSDSVYERALNLLTHAIDKTAEISGKAPVLGSTKFGTVPFRLDLVLRAGREAGVPWETLFSNEYLSRIVKGWTDAKAASKLSAEEQQMINTIKSKLVTDRLKQVAPIVDNAEAKAAEVQAIGNPVDMQVAKDTLSKEAEQAALNQGAEGAVADGVKNAVKDITDNIPENNALKSATEATAELSKQPLSNLPTYKTIEVLRDEANQVVKELRILGFRGTDDYLFKSVKGAEVLDRLVQATPDALKKMFNNAHGMAHIWPDLRKGEASADSFVEYRTRALMPLLSEPSLNTVEKQQEALRALAVEDYADEGAQKLRDFLEPWLGPRTSLFTQAGMGFEELNPFLRQEFGSRPVIQFGEDWKGPLGETIPATRENFVNQLAKVDLNLLNKQNPMGELLYGVTSAVEKAHAQATALAHLSATLGTTRNVKDFLEVNHPRLQGVKFPPEIHREVRTYLKKLDELQTSEKARTEFSRLMQDSLRMYDAALRGWKKSVTRYTPGYYARNFMGDAWISWVKGMNNPLRYKQASQVMRDIGNVVNSPEFYSGAPLEELLAQESPLLIKTRGGTLNSSQIFNAYTRHGVGQNISKNELFRSGIRTDRSITRPFAGKVDSRVEKFQEMVENYGRLPHFIDEMVKGMNRGFSMEKAATDAANVVRKSHFDYGDLTNFEKKVMKRVIPFYTWSRKSIPFLLENMMVQPWKMTVIPKINFGIAEMLGQDPQSFAQPWPVGSDALLPSWVKMGMLAQWGGGNDPLMGKVPDPMTDLSTGGVGGNMLTPAIKWPLDMYSLVQNGKPLFSQGSGDITRYIDSQIPIVSKLGSITNTSPVAGGLESLLTNPKPGTGFARTTDPNNPGGGAGLNLANLMSTLTGINMADINKQRQKSAQLEQKKGKK